MGKQKAASSCLLPALYVNGKYPEIGKNQFFARFPRFPALVNMFTSR
jgi:hypothetical protein